MSENLSSPRSRCVELFRLADKEAPGTLNPLLACEEVIGHAIHCLSNLAEQSGDTAYFTKKKRGLLCTSQV